MVTTSLREEIKEILDHSWDDEHDQAVDEILKLIEKRLDYVLDRLDPVDDKIKISALKQVKEMLK